MRCRVRALCVLLLLGGGVILTARPAFAQPAPAGFVKVAAGTTSVVRSGQTLPLKIGDPVHEGDVLQTGADGRLGVTLRDETRLSLGPRTALTLQSFAYAPEAQRVGLVLRMLRGAIEYVSGRIAKLAPDSIRLETPSSIIGVRGTHLLIGVEAR